MKDFVFRFDGCSFFLVAVALFVAARQVAGCTRYSPTMLWCGVAAFLGAGAWGFEEVRPTSGREVLAVVVVAWICSSVAALGAVVLVPPFVSLYEGWMNIASDRTIKAEWRRQQSEQQQTEQMKQAAEEMRRRAEEEADRNKPPPPTKPERLAEAKAKYEHKLQLLEEAGLDQKELKSGRELLKREYLNEVDGILR